MKNGVRILIAVCGLMVAAGPLFWSGTARATAAAANGSVVAYGADKLVAPLPAVASPSSDGQRQLSQQMATPTPTAAISPTVAAPVVPATTVVPPRRFTATTNPNDETVFTLERLGFGEWVMHGPFDWAGFTFALPAHWELSRPNSICSRPSAARPHRWAGPPTSGRWTSPSTAPCWPP